MSRRHWTRIGRVPNSNTTSGPVVLTDADSRNVLEAAGKTIYAKGTAGETDANETDARDKNDARGRIQVGSRHLRGKMPDG